MLMPNSPPARDRSLDVVRVTALAFMVAAHWGRALPDSYHLVNVLQFLFEVAPVLFFFAFGMTLDRFLRKPLGQRIESHLKLFILAVIHSLYGQQTPLSSDFFMFLFAARLLFDIHSQISAASRVLVAAFLLALCGAWVLLPLSVAYGFFMPSFPGWFPVFPWILFVAAGRIYSHRRRDPRTVAVAMLGLSLPLFDIFVLGRSLSKWPLSPDYALLFTSATALAFTILDRIRWPAFLPWRTIELLSGNLLLATALHYVAVAAVTAAHGELAPLLAESVSGRYLAPAFSLEYIAMAAVAVFILIALVRGAVAAAGWLDGRGILGTLNGLFPAIAVIGIVLYAGSLHLDAGMREAGLPLLCCVALLMAYKRA
ncbi:hypothetical protein ABMY26_30765 [Azospirillum sp. HJ39]|uniref:hypothetical protein n=1 Tax=Azospirillum sp. HJ39 TaxID=3159496 RepID=UPI0035586BD5